MRLGGVGAEVDVAAGARAERQELETSLISPNISGRFRVYSS